MNPHSLAVDVLGPVAARHDAAVDRYKADPSRENEALVRLYAAHLCKECFYGDSYEIYVEYLLKSLGA